MKYIPLQIESTAHHLIDAHIFSEAAKFHWKRSFAPELSTAKRRFHRQAAKSFRAKAKAARQNASFDWQKFCEAHKPNEHQ